MDGMIVLILLTIFLVECVPNKTEDKNLNVFTMITKTNEPKTLIKDISCGCKCKFNDRKCNSNQKWINDKCQCECKNSITHVCKKDYTWNSGIVFVLVKMGNIWKVLLMIQ